jgi:CubicO group peptidase (beta-lactamase class C family)
MASRGLSATSLLQTHDIMVGYVERGVAPGVITLIARHGEVHADVIGANAIDGAPLRRDSIMRIASMTKPIVASAAMILIEECVLRLDESVERWLPELSDMTVLRAIDGPIDDVVPANRSITVRDLLTFRLGAGFGFTEAFWGYPIMELIGVSAIAPNTPSPTGLPDPDTYMRVLGELPLLDHPGARWLYNTGSDVLGVLIARATGQSLAQVLQERIFDPLGMADTGFTVPREKLDRMTASYETNPATGALELYDGIVDTAWQDEPIFASGGGGLVSTVDDYATFAQMLLNGGKHGGRRLLSRPSVELMTTNQLAPGQGDASGDPDFGYGFGVGLTTRRTGLASTATYGWTGGLGTVWFNDPVEGLVAILLTQASWTSPVWPDIARDFITRAHCAIDD